MVLRASDIPRTYTLDARMQQFHCALCVSESECKFK